MGGALQVIPSPNLGLPADLGGATAPTRYVGGTVSGAPTSGTFQARDFVVDGSGAIWVCTTAGSPGTWNNVGDAANLVTSVFTRTGPVVATAADYAAFYPTLGATASEVELTALTATNVVTYTPTGAGNFRIGIYFRVVTATTTVTLTVTWTDVTGAQTLTLLNGVSEVTGSYALAEFMVNSAAATAITVTFTVGTVNQVYASASIQQG